MNNRAWSGQIFQLRLVVENFFVHEDTVITLFGNSKSEIHDVIFSTCAYYKGG